MSIREEIVEKIEQIPENRLPGFYTFRSSRISGFDARFGKLKSEGTFQASSVGVFAKRKSKI